MKLCQLLFYMFLCKLAFAQQTYKISVYEVVPRFNIHDHDEISNRHEITTLFIKADSLWKENKFFNIEDSLYYNRKDSFYEVSNGIKGAKIYGSRKIDTIYYFSRREVYYSPKPKLSIKSTMNALMLAAIDDTIPAFSRACFLTNNSSLKRNVFLKKYIPTAKDVKLIKSNFLAYINELFSSNCEEDQFFNHIRHLADSMKIPVPDTAQIKIDRRSSYVDNKRNRLLTFTIPYYFLWWNVYPFNSSCFREDKGKGRLRITCFINNQNQITFLRDELTYLEHGDFDNDGRDEFLFWYNIFNHNGYILYYDNFKKSAEFKWSYH